MKNKSSHANLIILRWFYNITGELDEYTLNQLHQFGNNAAMISQLAMIIALFAILAQLTGIACLVLFTTLTLTSIRQDQLIRQLGLDKLEIEAAELKAARRHMLHRTCYQTLVICLLTLPILAFIWQIQTPDSAITLQEFTYQFSPLAISTIGLFSFIFLYTTNLRKIKIID